MGYHAEDESQLGVFSKLPILLIVCHELYCRSV